ncbi:hypothetical protein H257_02447 [Aphanomyces astaci]|uniref:Uncharacterized protein n=1 Tax=Aphanomyces astaci TaxID=112090 RepID=W4H1Y7_APHAT|nr:hypothetical protein H257_02447 [Aphanomyces astaci]ETV85922.1 hypothetical protein H257_02447 [Aphanomyces astaci]|eukprot:XP_009824394.1 hypothetical protein H257_02447 [Aphanomyces astaci]
MEVQRKELLEEVMTWHHRMFHELLAQHHQLVEAHIDVFGTHPFTQRECRSVNKESFEETINPNTTSDNMTISDFIVDLCDEHVGDDGSCTVDQFYRVLDTISARAASELKLTTGDKIRTCYVIDRTLNSKRMSEGDVRKLSEHYQSKGVHMLLQWVVEAAWNPHEHDCANLLLRLLISLPPKDSVVRREFAGILTEQLPHRHGTTRELLQQLLTAFQ